MSIKKIEIKPPVISTTGVTSYPDTVYPKTSTDIVIDEALNKTQKQINTDNIDSLDNLKTATNESISNTNNKITENMQNTTQSINKINTTIGNIGNVNPDIPYTNLVDIINHVYGSRKVELGNITSFKAVSINEGTEIKLDWANPVSSDLVRVEIYVSETYVANPTYQSISSTHTKITNSKIQTIKYPSVKNRLFYFVAFSLYDVFGKREISEPVVISAVSEDKTPPNPITNFKVTEESNKTVSLSWTNPTNPDFSRTKINYKIGSYPTSSSDGTTIHNGFARTATVTNLVNEATYYFRAFTYDSTGNENNSIIGMQIKGVPEDAKIYGVVINEGNSNSETSVTYTNDAIGMVAAPFGGGLSSWDGKFPFNKIKPVLMVQGRIKEYLDKNDFSKNTKGEEVDIISGDKGNVMIEFPLIWWKIERFTSNKLHVKYSESKVDGSWMSLSHNADGGEQLDKIFIGAYLGYKTTDKLWSLSDKRPNKDLSFDEARRLIHNQSGYSLLGYNQLLMLQILFLIKYKNMDSQKGLGMGIVGHGQQRFTGNSDKKGMDFGSASRSDQAKFLGIEDIWGNENCYLDGIMTNSSNNLLTSNNNSFAVGGTNYTNRGTLTSGEGFISGVVGNTESGFIPKLFTGSSSTFYTDLGEVKPNSRAAYGGYYNSQFGAGIFNLQLSQSMDLHSNATRIMYVNPYNDDYKE